MKYWPRLSSIFLLVIIHVNIHAQKYSSEEEDKLPYERGFKFNEGIYFNFSEFRDNNPSLKTHVEERDGVIYYHNDSANTMLPYKKKHWGYSTGKNISLYVGNGYSRLATIGSLCYFAVVYSTSSSPAVGVSSAGGFGMGMSTGRQSSAEYFLDMKTGNAMIFNKKNITKLLEERDKVLLKEFKKRKGRKDAKLHYILNAYNSYHPIYFRVD